MMHMHLLGLLTFEILTLIAALFFLAYVSRQELAKSFRHIAKAIVVVLHVIIIASIIHAVVHHFYQGHDHKCNHTEMMQH